MVSDRLLRVTLAVSLFAHGAILLQSPHLNPFSPPPKEQTIKVRYLKKEGLVSKMPKQLADSGLGKTFSKATPFLKLDAKISGGNRIPPPYIEQENVSVKEKTSQARLGNNTLPPPSQSRKSANFVKPAFTNPDFTTIKKKITLPAIEMAKIDNPSYISYYQIVREKIRRSAYQNYTHSQTGEVYISFIISNDGLIKGVRLVEEKSSANEYLRGIALRSVNDASPFPNFPKELDYPQLSFNIIISFEIE
ncbi:MAG: TonB family protein [Candidatus Omnitrophica bacterium]|nr:TonB family protein [Candidatus Omnitrophota bacterium]